MAGFLRKLMPRRFRRDGVTIPAIRLHGAIMAGGSPLRPVLNLATVAPLLEKAFSVKDAPAVAISINSPGGSPVQSRLIYQRIRDLAQEKRKRVLIFVEDVAASGGYMIALGGRRDHRRSDLDRRFDRRRFGRLRFSRSSQKDRRGKTRLYGRGKQSASRSFPAGEGARHRVPQRPPARNPRHLHPDGKEQARLAPGRSSGPLLGVVLDGTARPGTWPRRFPRRYAERGQEALWGKGAARADPAGAEPFRAAPAWSGRGRSHCRTSRRLGGRRSRRYLRGEGALGPFRTLRRRMRAGGNSVSQRTMSLHLASGAWAR